MENCKDRVCHMILASLENHQQLSYVKSHAIGPTNQRNCTIVVLKYLHDQNDNYFL